jgi:hypothetical protein
MIKPTKQVKWKSVLSEQEQSGESAAAFCRARGVRESLFYYWKKRLRGAAVPQFVEVELTKGKPEEAPACLELGTTIEVRLRSGRSLVVRPEFSASHLRAVLAVVEGES